MHTASYILDFFTVMSVSSQVRNNILTASMSMRQIYICTQGPMKKGSLPVPPLDVNRLGVL